MIGSADTHKQTGFTIVELLVVIVVIGILLSITVVGFGKVQQNSRDTARETQATILADSLEKYYNANGEYPSTAALTEQSVTEIKRMLKLSDTDVLSMPGSDADNSLTATDAATDTLAYNGVRADQADQCEKPTSQGGDVDGGCDKFSLRWVEESDNERQIDSRHGREIADTPPEEPGDTSATSYSETEIEGFCSSSAPSGYNSINYSGGSPVNGTDDPDIFYVNGYNGVVNANGGGDIVCVSGGNMTIYGNGDDDVLYCGSSNVSLYGGSGDDTIYCPSGANQTLNGNAGNDTFYLGQNINTTVSGGGDDDTIYTVAGGSKTINGNAGNDSASGPSLNGNSYNNIENYLP